LFPLNCVFASSSQISQAAKEFCDAWGISSTCLGKKIVCYFGKSPTRNQLQRVNLGVTRMRVPSLTSQKCPFEIRFNWIKLKKHVVERNAIRAFRLLQVYSRHSCNLNFYYNYLAFVVINHLQRIKIGIIAILK
jgi:hypothetical protein